MTEADTCRKFVVPRLQQAGWDNDPHSIAEQRCFTAGRIVSQGLTARRSFVARPSSAAGSGGVSPPVPCLSKLSSAGPVPWGHLDRIGVWAWEPEYVNPNVLDGTQWTLSLSNAGRKMKSIGSNAYPGSDSDNCTDNGPFAEFLQALAALTGQPVVLGF